MSELRLCRYVLNLIRIFHGFDNMFGPFANIPLSVCGFPGVFKELFVTIHSLVVADSSLITCCKLT